MIDDDLSESDTRETRAFVEFRDAVVSQMADQASTLQRVEGLLTMVARETSRQHRETRSDLAMVSGRLEHLLMEVRHIKVRMQALETIQHDYESRDDGNGHAEGGCGAGDYPEGYCGGIR